MRLTITLPREQLAYVQAKVASGRYASAGEVIREALRMMKEQEQEKQAWLAQAFQEGLASGDAGSLNLSAEGRRRLASK